MVVDCGVCVCVCVGRVIVDNGNNVRRAGEELAEDCWMAACCACLCATLCLCLAESN